MSNIALKEKDDTDITYICFTFKNGYMKILVGTDFSKNSENALHYAADLASHCKGELLIVHVFQSMKPTGKMGLNQKIREDWEAEMQDLIEGLKKHIFAI